MSFAALRRLRRRFGLPNSAKVAEAHKYLSEEIERRSASGSRTSVRDRIQAMVAAAGLDSKFVRDLHWATALGDRARTKVDPSDDEVERFFDVLERYYGAELAEPVEPSELVGKVVGDRYLIEGVIGEGAAGVVYRARHVQTDAPVAVKVLHPSKVLRREIIGELENPRKFWEELVERFRREARASASVQHPGIVSVFDFGTEGAGFYQAMEFLSGETLKDAIIRESPMRIERAAKIVSEVASALDAAHARGVVHRDLKPANIFLCNFEWGESLKVLDFGIAKMVRDAEEEATRLTETGVFLGTYRYASPEQCLGEPVTPASDVYSLGVILFEMLASRAPFEGPSSVLAIRHATVRPPRVEDFRPDVPEALSELVARTLEKQPSKRFARGGELASALAPFAGGAVSVPVMPPPQPARQRRQIPADALAPSDPPQQARSRAVGSFVAGSHAPGLRSRDPKVFAEQLVDDILRYHPRDVDLGRAGNDLYRRLHNEIDMRWSMHASQYPDEETDYFYEVLVERLAGGDAGRLGPGMPDSTTQQRRRRRR